MLHNTIYQANIKAGEKIHNNVKIGMKEREREIKVNSYGR
jgi:hypothetical protein